MTIDQFITMYFSGAKRVREGEYSVLCPCHDDHNPSMSVLEGKEGRIVCHCHSCGANGGDVAKALGVPISEMMGAAKSALKKNIEIKNEYKYLDANGDLVFGVTRGYDNDKGCKTLWQWVPGASKGDKRIYKKIDEVLRQRGQKKPLYRLPELLQACLAGEVVYCVEGEKDADAMLEAGLVATSSPGGAGHGKFRTYYGECFAGARAVIVIPDNDPPPKHTGVVGWQGQDFAEEERAVIEAAGVPCFIVELPSLVNGHKVKDCYDYLHSGGDADGIESLANAALSEDYRWIHPRERPDAPVIPAPPKDFKGDAKRGRPKKEDEIGDYNDGRIPLSKRMGWYVSWLLTLLKPDHKEGRQPVTIDHLVILAKTWKDRENTVKEAHRNKVVCKLVLEWLVRDQGSIFYDEELQDFKSSMFFVKASGVLVMLNSNWFESWLARSIQVNREDRLFKLIISDIRDYSLHGPKSVGVTPSAYFERRDGAIYISSGVGRVCKIMANSVQMVPNGTDGVLFAANKTLLAWSLTPGKECDPFESCDLWTNMTAVDPRYRIMFKLWAMSFAWCDGSKPPLVITGGPGSGKTSAVRGLFNLYGLKDRNITVDAGDKGEASYWASLNQGGLMLLDNVDKVVNWLQNAVEQSATGGSKEVKRLYTDADTMSMRARSWVAISAWNPLFASSSAMSDRTIYVALDRVSGRVTKDRELYQGVSKIRNGGLTWIAGILSKALADRRPTGHINYRHPDFGRHALKMARAMGIEQEATDAMRMAELDKAIYNIKNNPFGEMFMQMVRDSQTFTSASLLSQMEREPDGERFVAINKYTVVKIGKALKALESSLKSLYQMEVKRVHGVNQYTVRVSEDLRRSIDRLLGDGVSDGADTEFDESAAADTVAAIKESLKCKSPTAPPSPNNTEGRNPLSVDESMTDYGFDAPF